MVRSRSKWGIAFALLVVVDTLITAYAIESGVGFEANPLVRPLIESAGYAALATVKAAVMAIVVAVWYAAPSGRFEGVVVNYATAAGVLVVAWNVLMVAASVFV